MPKNLRFRIYDEEENILYPPFTFPDDLFAEYGGGIMVSLPGENVPLANYSEGSSQVFLRYTGFRDKNNEEIYEGDLLQFTEGDDLVTFLESAESQVQVQIQAEVVGNIYLKEEEHEISRRER